MTRLAEFLEKVCAGGDPVRPELHAYRMDGTSSGANMRASAGLGTCNCCDYFTLSSGTVAVSDDMAHDDARGFDHVRAELMGDLRSVLTPAVVKDVRIVPTGKLGTMLPPQPLPR